MAGSGERAPPRFGCPWWPRLSLVATLVLLGGASAPAGAANLSPANGQGSTYAALAFQEWTQSVQNQGLNLNYTPTSSPAGLEAYSQNTGRLRRNRGRVLRAPSWAAQHPPARIRVHARCRRGDGDHVQHRRHRQRAGPHYLPASVAADDRQDLLGRHHQLGRPGHQRRQRRGRPPNERITVVCRTGQSGTTALFYDFVAHTDPTDYASWAAAERLFDRFEDPRGRQCNLAAEHGVPVGLGHRGELHRRQPLDHRLRRVRLRQGLQRQRRLGAERLGQLGAAVRSQHQRRAAIGPTRP